MDSELAGGMGLKICVTDWGDPSMIVVLFFFDSMNFEIFANFLVKCRDIKSHAPILLAGVLKHDILLNGSAFRSVSGLSSLSSGCTGQMRQ